MSEENNENLPESVAEPAVEPVVPEVVPEAVTSEVGAPEAVAEAAADVVPTAPLPAAVAEAARGRRTEKIGIVLSDKMQKSVVVRVDRLVKHPVYKRYVRKRTKFMAHNEIDGVSIGDQVRIVETRPLSARKRWRVVEVLRKASK